MERPEHKFQLIPNRFIAITAVCLTGYLAASEVRTAFSGDTHKSGWLIPLDSSPLPIWAAIILNLCFYTYMLWLGFWGHRGTQGDDPTKLINWGSNR
jgi:hypothetical protein